MKKIFLILLAVVALLVTGPGSGWSAYHHEGEDDSAKFLSVYPEKAGSKLDHCALCHSGGSYESGGKITTLGSCQWCHYKYGYDGSGDILDTLNSYGLDYMSRGSTKTAVEDIADLDSDGDGFSNFTEVLLSSYPGDANDDPTKIPAPSRVYTRAQLAAMPQHTQFLLMNTSRSGDFYASYSGVPMKDLLDDAGIDLANASGIMVYAPDGWAQFHPLDYDESLDMYHVYADAPGESYQYPPATYYYDTQADQDENPDGWCDYSAESCSGRSHGSAINVSGGLKAILAINREGAYLDSGVLNDENKLDGEGPFRVVVPQKYVGPPDQSSRSSVQDVIWPYDYDLDHNAGSCSRSATIIKVLPLPASTTDIDILEAGWSYVDASKIVVYGAIDGTDSNGNGVLDSEEGVAPSADFDSDGTPDYRDPDTAYPRHAEGIDNILIHTSDGDLANVEVTTDDDPSLPTVGKPASMSFPYGATRFQVVGLEPGAEVTVTMVFPNDVPTTAKYYKITPAGWAEIPMDSNDGDETITLTLTDGDPATDADGKTDGIITDPGALGQRAGSGSSSSDDTCFITTAMGPAGMTLGGLISGLLLLVSGLWAGRFSTKR